MRRTMIFPAVLLAMFALAGCGGDDDTATDPAASADGDADLTVLAEDISFPQDTYTADAGEVEVSYQNVGTIRHTLLVRDAEGNDIGDFELDVSSNGDVDQGSVDVEPGQYEFYCDVAGHEAAGMVADFVVE
ncbi:MAG: plastocyanin/azurin family copper-binding protein [Acidimicrobiales bacterium]|nr:plastocyanin/azurin family copper-binding protein [Acidimicrobiales bacterium]